MNRPNYVTASALSGTSTSVSPCAGRFEPVRSVNRSRGPAARSNCRLRGSDSFPQNDNVYSNGGLPVFDFLRNPIKTSHLSGGSVGMGLFCNEIVTLTVKERAWYNLAERTQRKFDGHEGSPIVRSFRRSCG